MEYIQEIILALSLVLNSVLMYRRKATPEKPSLPLPERAQQPRITFTKKRIRVYYYKLSDGSIVKKAFVAQPHGPYILEKLTDDFGRANAPKDSTLMRTTEVTTQG